MFGKKKKEEKEEPYEIPVIDDSTTWNGCFIAADSVLKHGELAKAVDFWMEGVDRWDGEGTLFPSAYRAIAGKVTDAVLKAVEPGTVYPVPALARLEAEMDVKHPGAVDDSLTQEVYDKLAAEIPKAMDPQDAVVLYMNCCYLAMGYMGWAADIREVPIRSNDCINLGDVTGLRISEIRQTGKKPKLNQKLAKRSVLLFKNFFSALYEASSLVIEGKSLAEIETAVMFWEANRCDRTAHLADGLDAMSRYAMATKVTGKKHLKACQEEIADFVDEYFEMKLPEKKEKKEPAVKDVE
jgi:hypothetical protein